MISHVSYCRKFLKQIEGKLPQILWDSGDMDWSINTIDDLFITLTYCPFCGQLIPPLDEVKNNER